MDGGYGGGAAAIPATDLQADNLHVTIGYYMYESL